MTLAATYYGANGWLLKAALFDDVETVLKRYLPQG